jgi:hypothetical protein
VAGVMSWPATGGASGPVQAGEERAWRRLSQDEYRVAMSGRGQDVYQSLLRVCACCVWEGGDWLYRGGRLEYRGGRLDRPTHSTAVP